jgi:protein-L-isoaspartate(D-aspartate) O-methyltransferase
MPAAKPADSFESLRRTMVSNQLRTVAVDDPRVVSALGEVPREQFVPEDRRALAYADLAVPLGGGRALNTPMATARLINAAGIGAGDKVLIVGAATGYAAAVALQLGAHVTALEPDEPLAEALRKNVPQATVVVGDLVTGAPVGAPYDVIVIDGAVEQLAPALVDQLAPSGRLATGIVEGGVTRLAVGRKGGTGFGLVAFADADVVVLPGFARPRAFVF